MNAASSTITTLVIADALSGTGFTNAFDTRLNATTTLDLNTLQVISATTTDSLYVGGLSQFTGATASATALVIGNDISLYRSAANMLTIQQAGLNLRASTASSTALVVGGDVDIYRSGDRALTIDGTITVTSCTGCGGGGGGAAWQKAWEGQTTITPTTTAAGIYVTASSTIDSTLRITGELTVNGGLTTTSGTNLNITTGGTADEIRIGGAAQTGNITLGESSGAQTVNIGTGAAGTNANTINLGTTGTGNSGVTTVNIGNTNSSTGATVVNIYAGTTGTSAGPKVTLGSGGTTGVCSSLANATSPTAGTVYELRDCTATPGADYAEIYPVEEGAEYGDLMAVGTELIEETQHNKFVTKLVKTSAPYQKNVVGVVSDSYGDFNSIGYNIAEEDNPMLIALNGRVPVKVAQDSEPIEPGDYLTSSAVPGRATKATRAGQVIGKALEPWRPGMDQVMIYVEQGYQSGLVGEDGQAIASLFSFDESGNVSLSAGLTLTASKVSAMEIEGMNVIAENLTALSARVSGMATSTSQLIMDELATSTVSILNLSVTRDLMTQGSLAVDGAAEFKKTVTFRTAAVFEAGFTIKSASGIEEVILGNTDGALETSRIKVKKLTAEKIDSPTIDSLLAQIGEVASSTMFLADRMNSLAADLEVLKTAQSSALDFNNVFLASGGLKVDFIQSISDAVNFSSDVVFFGRPYFTTDTAGFALIRSGEQQVQVVFEREYLEQPIVNATIALDEATTTLATGLDELIFSNDIRYIVTKKSAKGFTILLNKAAPVDIQFSWITLAVKEPKIFQNEPPAEPAPAPTASDATISVSEPAAEVPPPSAFDASSTTTLEPVVSTEPAAESPPSESEPAPAPEPTTEEPPS